MTRSYPRVETTPCASTSRTLALPPIDADGLHRAVRRSLDVDTSWLRGDGSVHLELAALVYPRAEQDFAAMLERIDRGDPIEI